MSRRDDVRPTPQGLRALDQISRSQVWYRTADQIVVRPVVEGDTRYLEDISALFVDIRRLGWAYIAPYDIDARPPPPAVPCLLTPDGEDVLMEAQQAAKKRRAKR